MKNALYVVVRWTEDKTGGELSLGLSGLYPSKDDAARAILDEQKVYVSDLNESDCEFERSSFLDMEYQRDSQHDQYWSAVPIESKDIDVLERAWLCDFATDALFNQERIRNHLLCLWTVYCLHHNMNVGTERYAMMAATLWEVVKANNSGPWKDFDAFGCFLSQHLV